jgi:hypothetical protein
MLKRLSAVIAPDKLFAYPTRIGSRNVIAIAWGDNNTDTEAQQLRPILPAFIQAQRPMLRSNKGIRSELGTYDFWR